MYKYVWFCDFFDSFSDTYKNNFSYNGKRALFDYLEQYEEEVGEKIELDTIALCCEYIEFDDVIEAASEYFTFEGMTFWENWEELKKPEEVEKEARKFLQDNTILIEFEGGVIIRDF